jgi:type IV secretion system protein TrbL
VSGCAGWNSVNPLCRAGQLIGGAAKSVDNDVFSSIAHYFASVASSAVTWLWDQLDSATAIDLGTPGIKADLIATGSIAALITFALFLIQIAGAVLRQEPGALGRGVRGLSVSFIGAAFAIATTQLLLAAVDSLCNGVVQFALGTNKQGLGSKLVVAATLSSISNPAGLLLLSLVLIAAVVVVWIALMIFGRC